MNTDFYTYEELERLFEEAAKLGVTSVQIPVEWKDIEVKEDEWDFSYLHAVLTFANKYNLKMELLWFGTNMVGDSHSYTIPDYILKDGKTYLSMMLSVQVSSGTIMESCGTWILIILT